MHFLSKEEIKALPWNGDEKWAVVNTHTRKIFLGAQSEEECEKTLEIMTPKHPMYSKMLIVKRNEL